MSIVPIEDQRQKSWNATASAHKVTTVDNDGTSTEEMVFLLRRICRLLESNSVVDSASRQKVALDSMTAGTLQYAGIGIAAWGNIPGLTPTAPYTAATGYPLMIAEGPVDQRWRVIEAARTAYAVGIRANLLFS